MDYVTLRPDILYCYMCTVALHAARGEYALESSSYLLIAHWDNGSNYNTGLHMAIWYQLSVTSTSYTRIIVNYIKLEGRTVMHVQRQLTIEYREVCNSTDVVVKPLPRGCLPPFIHCPKETVAHGPLLRSLLTVNVSTRQQQKRYKNIKKCNCHATSS